MRRKEHEGKGARGRKEHEMERSMRGKEHEGKGT